MQYVYRCTRCGTGWLAKMVEPRDQGWVVHVFICNRCRYASQPGKPLAVQEGEGALLASVHAAIVPVARLTGPVVEALPMEEIFTLLGLLPDAPGARHSGQPLRLQAVRPASSPGGARIEGSGQNRAFLYVQGSITGQR